jgi:hypothetical protein
MSELFTDSKSSSEQLIKDGGPTQSPLVCPFADRTHGKDLEYIRQSLMTAAGLVLALLILTASLVDFVHIAPGFPGNGLDNGWVFALNAAMAKGLVFGRDIVFTFGPFASAYTAEYNPATDTQMLWSGCLLAMAFAASLNCLTRGFGRLSAAGLAVFLLLVPADTRFLAIPFTSLVLLCRVALPADHFAHIAPTMTVRLTLAVLVAALAMLPLVKGTYFVASGIVMVLGLGLLVLRGHRALAIGGALLFAVALPTLWLLARQPLNALPGYFLALSPVIGGYSVAMSLPGPAWQFRLYAECCLALGLLNGRTLYPAGAAGRCLLAAAAALLFLAFKEGFVRDDVHALTAAGMLGVAGWGAMLLGRQGLAPLMGLTVGLMGWALIYGSVFSPTPAMLVSGIAAPFAAAEHGLVIRLTQPGQLQQQYADSLRAIQAEQQLPKLAGTVDIYSYGQSALLANGLDWDPRPALQSYVAYTSGLERQDADHLTGAGAPSNIIFSVQPIDNRLPALEDGASWPVLLTRYAIVGLRGDLMILKRRATPPGETPVADVPSVSGTFQLGETIPIPPFTSAVWAQFDVRPALAGRLMAMLFKPPALGITYLFPDGHTQSFRYIAGMGSAGFVVAPVIQTTTDFAALALPPSAHYFAGRQPAFLEITADYGAGWLWRASFSARFSALPLPIQPDASRLLAASLERPPSEQKPQPAAASTTADR